MTIAINGDSSGEVYVPYGQPVTFALADSSASLAQAWSILPPTYEDGTAPDRATNWSAWSANPDGSFQQNLSSAPWTPTGGRPDVPDSWLIRCVETTTGGPVTHTAVVRVRNAQTGEAAPAAAENTEAGALRGWWNVDRRWKKAAGERRGQIRVYNNSGASITDKWCKITGSVDFRTVGGNASPGGSASKPEYVDTIAVASSTDAGIFEEQLIKVVGTIASGAFGWAATSGKIAGDYSAFSANAPVYLGANGAESATPSPVRVGHVKIAAVSGFLNAKPKPASLTTYTQLRAAIGSRADQQIEVTGRDSAGDGNRGTFEWTTDTTNADDDGVLIVPTVGGWSRTGAWKRVVKDGRYNVKWFGAKHDSGTTNNTTPFTNAINAANRDGVLVKVPPPVPSGEYWFLAGSAALPPFMTAEGLEGSEGRTPILKWQDLDGDCLRFRGGKTIRGIYVDNLRSTAFTNRSAVIRITNSLYGVYRKISANSGADNCSNLMAEFDYRTATITNVSNTNPIVVTCAAGHNFHTGDRVAITGVGGTTSANVADNKITRISSTQFSIDGVAGNGAYTSGGTVYDRAAAYMIAHVPVWYDDYRSLQLNYLVVGENKGIGLDLYVNPNAIGVVNPPGEAAGTYNGSVAHARFRNLNIEGKAKGISCEGATHCTFSGGQMLGSRIQFYGRNSKNLHFRDFHCNQWGELRSVTGATNATPIVITVSGSHPYQTGDRVRIKNVGGNTAANGAWTVTRLSSTTFSLNTSVGNGAYTSGGEAMGGSVFDFDDATCRENDFKGLSFFHVAALNWEVGPPGSDSTFPTDVLGAVPSWDCVADGIPHTGTITRGRVRGDSAYFTGRVYAGGGISNSADSGAGILCGNGENFSFGDWVHRNALGSVNYSRENGNTQPSTDATPVDIYGFQVTANSVNALEFVVSVRRTGGARGTGAVGDGATFWIRASIQHIGSISNAPDVLGWSVSERHVRGDLADAGIDIVDVVGVSPGIVKITAKGASALSLTWQTKARIIG